MNIPDSWRQRLRPGKLAQDTLNVGLWQGIRIGCQAAWVMLVAHVLGPHGYGTFAGAAGLATALGGFVGLGLGLVMLQDVARDPSLFDDRWRKASLACVVSGALLAALFITCASLLLSHRVPFLILLAIGLSELLLFPIVSMAAFAFSSRHRMGTAAALPAVAALGRVIAALAFWIFATNRSLGTYIWFHAVATLLCAVASWFWVQRALQPLPAAWRISRRDVGEGLSFSTVWLVGNSLSSLDKTLVLRLAGAEIAGLYSVAYRFATVLAMPVDALTMAAGPRLFRHGSGTEEQPGLIPKLLLSTLIFSLLAGCALWALADMLPWLLGPRFMPAVTAAHGMALFVPCYSLRLLGSNVLMASDGKVLRASIEAGGLLLLVILACLWLPTHGLQGAVAMICTTEATLAIAVWLVIGFRRVLR